jgi:hypothetical protein
MGGTADYKFAFYSAGGFSQALGRVAPGILFQVDSPEPDIRDSRPYHIVLHGERLRSGNCALFRFIISFSRYH